MVDLTGLNRDELVSLKEEAGRLIKTKKAEEKARIKAEAEDRASRAKDNLKEGCRIIFAYGGEDYEGDVTRVSEKSFTVSLGENETIRRPFDKCVSILSTPEEEVA